MDPIFWIPIGTIVVFSLLGAWLGARSSTASTKTGFLVAFFLSFMTTLPLIAIGFANA